MTRFSRYLYREIVPLYLAGLIVLLVLLLAYFLINVLADVLARGVPPSLVARFLLYKLPGAGAAAVPLGLLFAALLALTRLQQDSEIKAALMLGLGPRSFATPMLTLGLAVSALSLLNNELVVPWSEARALEAQKDILLQSPDTLLEEGSFFTDALGRSIFLERLEPGGAFEGVTVIQPLGSTGPSELIRAARGRLDEEAGVWTLEDIDVRVFRRGRLTLDFRAERGELPVRDLAAGSVGPGDLTYLPLRELLARLRDRAGRPLPAERTALHRKFAEPLAATAFALFALAMALFTFRRGVQLGFVWVLLLTFAYYATWSVAKLLGANGTLPPWFAGWLPVGLYALAGGTLLALSWRR